MVAFKYSLDPMVMKIQRDLRVNDQGFNIIFTGMPGSGKSLACASMCYAVDPSFNIKRCAFNVEEFIDLLNADLPKGSAIMWDESNIGNDAKNAMTVENKQMAFISQSMRSHNNFIALTTPSQDFQDKRTRLMLNAYVEMMPHESMNRLTGRSMGRYYVLQQNYRYSRIYFKSPVIQAYSGPVCLPVLKFKLPPKEFIEAYVERKRQFK